MLTGDAACPDCSAVHALCDALRESKILRKLDVSDNALRAEGAQVVGTMLAVNESITAIDLARNDITQRGQCMDGIVALAAVFRDNDHLSALGLASNCLCGLGLTNCGDAVGKYRPQPVLHLLKCLEGNQVMNALDLSNNVIGGKKGTPPEHTERVISSIAAAVANSWSLNITLRHNFFDSIAAQRLSSGVCADRVIF